MSIKIGPALAGGIFFHTGDQAERAAARNLKVTLLLN